MASRPGFFSLLAESQRRKETIRRNSDRELPRRTPTATNPVLERNGSSSRIDTDDQIRGSTPTAIPSDLKSDSIVLITPALGNSTLWESSSPIGQIQSKGLSDATEAATLLCEQLSEANNYLSSVESTWDKLCTARWQVETLLNCAASPDEQLRFRAMRTLGNIYVRLGDYDQAQSVFLSLCPSLPLTRAGLTDLRHWHKVDALLCYLSFSTTFGRDLEQAETVARILPWASPDVLRTEDRKFPTLLNLIQILNGMGRHADAYDTLGVFEATCPPKHMLEPEYDLQRALAAAGRGSKDDALALFIEAFVVASSNGIWHSQTLSVLFEFGRALKAWRQYGAALRLLTICAKVRYYTSGKSHPRSIQVLREIEGCEGAGASLQALRQFGHLQYSLKRKWSWAYEQTYLTTPIELLKPVTIINFERLSKALRRRLDLMNLSRGARFNVRRSLAWAAFELNKLNAASVALYELYTEVSGISTDVVRAEAYRATLAGDEAIFFAKSDESGVDFMRQRSKLVYLELIKFPKARSHQVKAILRRMRAYNLTHFTHEVVFCDPPLIVETNRKKLGTGSFATVDTVQVGERFFARKAISLPRQSQRQARLREDIRTEIDIMHALDHPHIVRVLFTYEEENQFSIIMHPLADSDLETYLSNKVCDTTRERRLIWRWMTCLTNTLAFIHSKDIRHKDIKPRNVLVKGEKIYFTDFGSGHMFSDTGNSTTDGFAYGHTRAYCAPEVIKNDNRNRLSDVFSLGCVLAEMAAWSSDIPINEFFSAIKANENNTDTVQYHDSIMRIKRWFEEHTGVTERSKQIWLDVLRHMIRKNPRDRWTAAQISRAIGKVLPDSECVKCDIDVWVSTSVATQE